MNKDWYSISNIDNIDSPCLIVFSDRVKANIQTAIKIIKDVDRLRPHVKTCKSPDAVTLMQEAGINKFKCATIAEAEMLGICNTSDVLLAYQPVGPKLKRFTELIKKHPETKYSCLTDNLFSAKEQSDAFIDAGISVPVYIDINPGMNRTGIAISNAFELYEYCSKAEGIVMKGLHVYDGHFRNPDIAIRKKECDEAFKEIENLKERIIKEGLPVPHIIAGGSPTFPIHAERKEVECSPGTFIYWDKGYADICAEQNFLPAAVLITRVISKPFENRICTDLGHKSVASENEIERRVYFLNAEDVKPIGQSEEHLVLEVANPKKYKPGDVLFGLPYHVCPTVALYEKVYTADNGKVSGEWKTIARDRSISI